MDYFKASGKSLIAYMDAGAEKEYFLALGCDEVCCGGGDGHMYLGTWHIMQTYTRSMYQSRTHIHNLTTNNRSTCPPVGRSGCRGSSRRPTSCGGSSTR